MEDAIQSSVYVSTPDFAGWLMKRGFHWRKMWKRRWIALHGLEIVYMDKEPTPENMHSVQVSKAKILDTSEVQDSDPEGNPLGFTIAINDGHSPTWHLRAETPKEKKAWMVRIRCSLAIVKWLGSFEKVKVLGVGGTGIVYELFHKTNGQRFALKEIEIRNQRQRELAVSEAEMLKDIMENVSHPSVMHIEKVFQVGSKFYLVFPLCTGGELYESIIKRGSFTERDAAVIIRDLVSGLQALHQHNILHLDIKPENILFDGPGPDAHIKITDFGLSRIFKIDANSAEATAAAKPTEDYTYEKHLQKVEEYRRSAEVSSFNHVKGTVGYMSPELILFDYKSRAADVFASGVILYILLTGRPPFARKTDKQTMENTIFGTYDTSHQGWKQLSESAQDLVVQMLTANPKERISTENILKHPWIVAMTQGVDTPASNHDATMQADTALSNLNGTLKLLSKHVSRLRSTKIATNLTRLATLMRNGQVINKNAIVSLADKYLVPKDSGKAATTPKGRERQSSDVDESSTTPGAALSASLQQAAALLTVEDPEDEIMMFQNSEVRDALAVVIAKLTHSYQGDSQDGSNSLSSDENGSSGGGLSVAANSFSAPGLTVEQFILLLQHLHYAPANGVQMKTMNRANVGALLFSRFVDRDNDGYITLDDIINAQAMILQRSEQFLKLLFRIYLEVLWYPGRQLNFMNLMKKNPTTPSHRGSSITTDGELLNIVDVVEPPKYITAKHVAAVFDKLGYSTAHVSTIFDQLCEIAQAERQRASQQREGLMQDEKSSKMHECDGWSAEPVAPPPPPPPLQSSDMAELGDDAPEPMRDTFYASSPNVALKTRPRSQRSPGADEESDEEETDRNHAERVISTESRKYHAMHAGQRTLDIVDFLRVAGVDDILVQAIVRSPRRHTSWMLQRAIKASEASNGQFPPSYYIEEELLQALRDSDKNLAQTISSYASTFGKLTLSAAFDLASMLSTGKGGGGASPQDEVDISI